jgi:hypothetical protein
MKVPVVRLFSLIAVLGLGLTNTAAAQLQFGVTAGLNFNRLTDISFGEAEANFDNKTGWHIGVWAEVGLGPLDLRPGVRYMDAGNLFNGLSDIFEFDDFDDDFDVNLVEVPILLRYGFGSPVVKPYVFAGPVIRFPSASNDLIEDDFNSPTLAGELGLGLEVALGGISLYPEIAFTFGLTSFIDEDETIIGSITTDNSQHLNVAMLRLGIGL